MIYEKKILKSSKNKSLIHELDFTIFQADESDLIFKIAKKRFASSGQNFLSRALALLAQDDFGPQFGVAISYLLQLLSVLIDHPKGSAVVKKTFELEKLGELLIHPCLNVRLEAVKFFASLFSREKTGKIDTEWVTKEDNPLRQVGVGFFVICFLFFYVSF